MDLYSLHAQLADARCLAPTFPAAPAVEPDDDDPWAPWTDLGGEGVRGEGR
jgi:hypothetical protein